MSATNGALLDNSVDPDDPRPPEHDKMPAPKPRLLPFARLASGGLNGTSRRLNRKDPWTRRRIVLGLRKHAAAVLFDVLAVTLAHQLATLLRFDGLVPPDVADLLLLSFPFLVAIYIAANAVMGLYWRAWQYAGLTDAIALSKAAVIALCVVLVVDISVGMALHKRPVPLSIAFAGAAFSLLAMGGIKLAPRVRRSLRSGERRVASARLLIFGAGEAGQWLVREIRNSARYPYLPVCFVDDDPRKTRLRIHGVPVLGTRDDMPRLVEQYQIDVVAVAIPSAPGNVAREVVSICQGTNAQVRIVPGVSEILSGRGGNRPLREMTIEDLLGREPVRIDLAECAAYITGKVVLLTGAAGSIGSELARQVVKLKPSRLVLLDSNESGLHDLALRLKDGDADERMALAVCSVDRYEAVHRQFVLHRPQVVFHAAAYKHVPLMEQHPEQAVLVNIGGTANVCIAAEEFAVERMVLISTDKAVKPANVMGASKRFCEELVRSFGETNRGGRSGINPEIAARDGHRVIYCAVRFGNVLDSRGSVIPTFKWQIDQGGPVTVTHPQMRRFFMTIPEAASLVIQAGAYATGGDVFLLDMGEEMNITDLAEKMILLRGLRPGHDIQVRFTGLRPGEKLREELTIEHEALRSTHHPKINRVSAGRATDRNVVLGAAERLRDLALSGNSEEVRTYLYGVVREFDRWGRAGTIEARMSADVGNGTLGRLRAGAAEGTFGPD